jgi:acyl carrier protein
MLSEEKLRAVVASMLELDPSAVGPETSTDTVDQWDSVRHMNLIIALEGAFDITIPDEDVANLTSYPIIKAVVEEQLARAG